MNIPNLQIPNSKSDDTIIFEGVMPLNKDIKDIFVCSDVVMLSSLTVCNNLRGSVGRKNQCIHANHQTGSRAVDRVLAKTNKLSTLTPPRSRLCQPCKISHGPR